MPAVAYLLGFPGVLPAIASPQLRCTPLATSHNAPQNKVHSLGVSSLGVKLAWGQT